MKLHRLVMAELRPPPAAPWKPFGMETEEVEVKVQSTWPASDHERIALSASVRLDSLPALDERRAVLVPETARRRAESWLRFVVALWGASQRVARQIGTLSPDIALEAESAEEGEWLNGTAGIRRRDKPSYNLRPAIPLDEPTIMGLLDRADGVELCAEAMAQGTASGKFRDFIRLFEAAFGRWRMKQLRSPLIEFLRSHDQFGYTGGEVRNWVDGTRHGITHRGNQDALVLDEDVKPIIGRVEQAALDVLFNKKKWGDLTVDRRDLWRPSTGSTGPTGGAFVRAGEELRMEFSVFDGMSGLPRNLQSLNKPPEPWWYRMAMDEDEEMEGVPTGSMAFDVPVSIRSDTPQGTD